MKKQIIWDWNGTLVNDVDISVEAFNFLLKKYQYDKILSVEKYRKIFTFPVKNYYLKAGFDLKKHHFEIVGLAFIDIYNSLFSKSSLQKNALEVLSVLKEKNVEQVIISARQNDSLLRDVQSHNIQNFFTKITGISDNYANGKDQLFQSYLSDCQNNKSNIYLIGDTFHDYEISRKFDLNFIHFSEGHQDSSHFEDFDIVSINNLSDILQIIL